LLTAALQQFLRHAKELSDELDKLEDEELAANLQAIADAWEQAALLVTDLAAKTFFAAGYLAASRQA